MKQYIPIVLLLLITISFLSFFRIKNVECWIESEPCPQEVLQSLEILKDKSFFFTNIPELFTQATVNTPIYQIISVQKDLTGLVSLELKREQARYKFTRETDSITEDFYFGETGIQLPEYQGEIPLNVIWFPESNPIENQKIEKNIHTSYITVTEVLQKNSIDFAILEWYSNSEIILDIENEPIMIFDAETLQTQIKKIDTILSARELAELENQIVEIDMRFDLPVLRTAE